MPVSALAAAALEQLVESRFGLLGVFGLVMLSAGYHKRNFDYALIGGAVLALLVMSG
ncbi:hypothetical protein [Streptomyces carminius]|uniref:hypothetical protein n=1 Tax=Streptomyces carminius TaxID=2665496 RepID=UPI0013046DE1|nr:hypothetical protein [Streptomyces carminius]